MLQSFRIIALLEGVSYLLIFGLTMPLKYWAGILFPNKVVGYIHGTIFLLYLVLAIVLWVEKKWGFKKLLLIILASLLPFGTFYLDRYYLKPLVAKKAQQG